jgi:hypothetical protein
MQSVQVNRYNLRRALYPTNPAHIRGLNKCTAMFRTYGDKERSGVVTSCGAVAGLIVQLDPSANYGAVAGLTVGLDPC